MSSLHPVGGEDARHRQSVGPLVAQDQRHRHPQAAGVVALRRMVRFPADRSIAWAFADACKADYGAKLADARLDLKALATLDAVWAARGDSFDAVFDSPVTVWEALARIARCGRAVPIPQGGVVRIVRDAPQTLPVAM